ncbi:centromere protein X-like [Dama dama]|uniref:centromere protein X-like n=1 Tax=Dama dama TaxID=30532 RepID=UPI002A3591F4|nr:centromere protein X-like [Dama dama]
MEMTFEFDIVRIQQDKIRACWLGGLGAPGEVSVAGGRARGRWGRCDPCSLPDSRAGPEPAPALPSRELVSKLLHLHFKDKKTKVSGDALQLMAELLKIFVVEAAIRSVRQAQAEELDHVDVEQLEKVLPQLLLDF